jgi:hypothetical protein
MFRILLFHPELGITQSVFKEVLMLNRLASLVTFSLSSRVSKGLHGLYQPRANLLKNAKHGKMSGLEIEAGFPVSPLITSSFLKEHSI